MIKKIVEWIEQNQDNLQIKGTYDNGELKCVELRIPTIEEEEAFRKGLDKLLNRN
ncbi:hypothetical protein [Peribacillus frigoritolerans]|uniref:hypothetical protein n=1 Tax=Peribacillus frigoritolerans TaxID=450367 RepID=UPI00207AFB6C|nr:hypothetical protein [Peribacillus frigoritolerans]USK77761.1 hypothetical protein LIT31_25880 [Peribacillus frigoritolerans]